MVARREGPDRSVVLRSRRVGRRRGLQRGHPAAGQAHRFECTSTNFSIRIEWTLPDLLEAWFEPNVKFGVRLELDERERTSAPTTTATTTLTTTRLGSLGIAASKLRL